MLTFREKCDVCTSLMLLDIVAVKESIFADFVFFLLGDLNGKNKRGIVRFRYFC